VSRERIARRRIGSKGYRRAVVGPGLGMSGMVGFWTRKGPMVFLASCWFKDWCQWVVENRGSGVSGGWDAVLGECGKRGDGNSRGMTIGRFKRAIGEGVMPSWKTGVRLVQIIKAPRSLTIAITWM
jgi:hypothetical protein